MQVFIGCNVLPDTYLVRICFPYLMNREESDTHIAHRLDIQCIVFCTGKFFKNILNSDF